MATTDFKNVSFSEKIPILLASLTFLSFSFFFSFLLSNSVHPTLFSLSHCCSFCSPYLLSPTLCFLLSTPTSTSFSLTSIIEKNSIQKALPYLLFPTSYLISEKPCSSYHPSEALCSSHPFYSETSLSQPLPWQVGGPLPCVSTCNSLGNRPPLLMYEMLSRGDMKIPLGPKITKNTYIKMRVYKYTPFR